jgi:hypothetical protein
MNHKEFLKVLADELSETESKDLIEMLDMFFTEDDQTYWDNGEALKLKIYKKGFNFNIEPLAKSYIEELRDGYVLIKLARKNNEEAQRRVVRGYAYGEQPFEVNYEELMKCVEKKYMGATIQVLELINKYSPAYFTNRPHILLEMARNETKYSEDKEAWTFARNILANSYYKGINGFHQSLEKLEELSDNGVYLAQQLCVLWAVTDARDNPTAYNNLYRFAEKGYLKARPFFINEFVRNKQTITPEDHDFLLQLATKNWQEAKEYLQKAYNFGALNPNNIFNNVDFEKELRKDADAGDVNSQIVLVEGYATGKHNIKKSFEKLIDCAAKEYETADEALLNYTFLISDIDEGVDNDGKQP